jgi:hypothetical protein
MKTKTTFLSAAVIGLCLITPALRAQEQPKPGPEHKKLEMLVGEWTYEGSGEATPILGAAGKFKGKFTSRMILGGFFVQSLGEDTSDNGYIYQQISLCGYDPVKRTYIGYSFENDGKVTTGPINVSGNTWTSTSTRTDGKGKVYKTKTVEVYAPDGKSSTSVTEYSADGGKTWSKAWSSKATKVGA